MLGSTTMNVASSSSSSSSSSPDHTQSHVTKHSHKSSLGPSMQKVKTIKSNKVASNGVGMVSAKVNDYRKVSSRFSSLVQQNPLEPYLFFVWLTFKEHQASYGKASSRANQPQLGRAQELNTRSNKSQCKLVFDFVCKSKRITKKKGSFSHIYGQLSLPHNKNKIKIRKKKKKAVATSIYLATCSYLCSRFPLSCFSNINTAIKFRLNGRL